MGKITMHPAAVKRWGKKAEGIGEDIWGQHKKLAHAGSEKTPTAGFTFDGAFDSFFDTWTGVVSRLGTTIGTVGGNLTGSANTVEMLDDDSAGAVEQSWRSGSHAQETYYGPTERPRD